ncbi:MAG TPA: hypothetical protein VGD74_10895, partial [Vulgatibacter sp.]
RARSVVRSIRGASARNVEEMARLLGAGSASGARRPVAAGAAPSAGAAGPAPHAPIADGALGGSGVASGAANAGEAAAGVPTSSKLAGGSA